MTEQPEHSEMRTPDEHSGWHEPIGATPFLDRQQWFIPESPATEEQLEALKVSIDPILNPRVEELPVGFPVRPGGWYSPQGSQYNIQPATALGELVGSEFDAFAALPAISPIEAAEPLAVVETEPTPDSGATPAPIIEIDESELAFRSAPYLAGQLAEGFVPAPEVPLSATLETGLGGLRDVAPPVAEDTPALADRSISLEEAAQQQSGVAPEVPARGLGGVQDVMSDTGPIPKELAADTGPVQVSDAGKTRSLYGTNQMMAEAAATPGAAATPTLQDMTQPYAESAQSPLMQPNQPMSLQPTMPPSSAQKFREVEQAVRGLRQQFGQGQITRNQLETELRRLMVLDEQGRWWTLGVDSTRWYRYDGREWVPDVPPQTGPAPAVMGMPTETGVQPPVAAAGYGASIAPGGDISMQPGGIPRIAIDEYGMPLPQRVPVEDPGATMVNLSAIGPRSDDPTLEGPSPAPSSVGIEAATLRPGVPGATISPGEAAQAVAGFPGQASNVYGDAYGAGTDGELTATGAGEPGAPYDRAKRGADSIQPDYSEALGGSLSRSGLTRLVIWSSVVGVVAVLGITLCLLLAMVGYYFSVVGDYSEAIDTLPERATTFQTSTLYASDGQTTLMQINDPNQGIRQKVKLEDISPWAIHALVSTEDETYYENPGFSVFAIMRATYTNLTGTGVQSGASTITQQLTRRLLLNEGFAAQVSANRKVTEIILAAEISRKYSKDEILELYFNEISFGGYTVGIEAAAQTYFGKSARDLNVAEAAFLVGMVQAPAVYDPFRNRDLALGRMQTVLRLMTEANGDGCIQMQHSFDGTIEGEGFNLAQPLCVTQADLETKYPHLIAFVETRPFLPPENTLRYPHFAFWARDQVFRILKEKYGYSENDVYNMGLRVVTTIDPNIQNIAQQALVDQIAFAPNLGASVNNGAVVVIEPVTGRVLAMVGSVDFRNQSIDGEVNVAFTPQQPGSSIKPVVYLTSFEPDEAGQYFTPATVIWDTPSDWSGYQPVNFDGEFRGPVTVRRALANSLNVPAVKALQFATPQRFEQVANRMGITFPLQSPVQAGLPSALGAAEVYLFEMVAGYAAFANNGVYNTPYGIQHIEKLDGEVLFDAAVDIDPATASRQSMDPTYAFLISSILSDGNARREEFGTDFSRLDLPGGRIAAVKTGTTNDNRDGWTIGWTPQIIVGVWMGNTDNSSMGIRGTGFNLAAPIWNKVMQQALQGQPILSFPQPPGITQMTVCVDSGARVPQNNPELCGPGGTNTEYFINTQPPPPADQSILTVVEVDAFTNLRANQFCPDYRVQRVFLNISDPTVVPWLQNTANGQAWAASRSIDTTNLQGTPPAGECQPGQAVPLAVLNSPFNGMIVSGLLAFTGQATVPNFDHYEFQYAPATAPDQYQIIPGQSYQFEQAQPGATLGTWASNGLPDGQYNFRLVVFSKNGAFATSPSALVTIRNTAEAQPNIETNTPPSEGAQ